MLRIRLNFFKTSPSLFLLDSFKNHNKLLVEVVEYLSTQQNVNKNKNHNRIPTSKTSNSKQRKKQFLSLQDERA